MSVLISSKSPLLPSDLRTARGPSKLAVHLWIVCATSVALTLSACSTNSQAPKDAAGRTGGATGGSTHTTSTGGGGGTTVDAATTVSTGGTTGTSGGDKTGGTTTQGTSGGTTMAGGNTAAGGAMGGVTTTGGTGAAGGATKAGGTSGAGGIAGSTATTGGAGGAQVPTNPTPPSELIGWAKTEKCGPKGTTGGGDGPPTVVVTSTSELVAALSAAGPKVIEVKGQMKGARLKDSVGVKDKTLIGTNGAFISDGMRIDKGHNLIIKNIRFGEAKVVAGDDNQADGFTVYNTTCVWIDHCEFMNSIDGNLDIVGGDGFMSSWVTVSWSKFWYEADYAANVNLVHRYSNLIVGSDDKPDPLPYVTYHHNWWAENVIERMPRGRWAWAHVFNNYYSTQGNNYGIGVSVGIQFVVENNFFEPGFKNPVFFFNKDQGAAVRLSGNQMDGVVWKAKEGEEGKVPKSAEDAAFGTAFNPADHYSYTLQSPADAKASVMANAGRK